MKVSEPPKRSRARTPLRSGAVVKILLAHSFYRVPGGEDGFVRQQAELLSHDHMVELFYKRNDELSASITTATKMLSSGNREREVARVLGRFRPNIVHVHNVYPALGTAMHFASAKARIPLVMTVHNYRMRCPNGLMFTEGSVCHRCQGGNYLNALTHRCFPSKQQSAAYAGHFGSIGSWLAWTGRCRCSYAQATSSANRSSAGASRREGSS